MTDGHIHIERGAYTLEWIDRFVDRAVETGLDEIRLLEYNFRFAEFAPMYAEACEKSGFVAAWFERVSGRAEYGEYLALIEKVRGRKYPVRIKFGLEICYFKEHEELTEKLTKDRGFDFLLGSIHFVDGFAFDHSGEHWAGRNIDRIYRRYFEDSVSLVESGMYADRNSGAERRCPDTAPLGMDKELIRALKKHGVKIITSSDAYCPKDAGYKIRELERLTEEC